MVPGRHTTNPSFSAQNPSCWVQNAGNRHPPKSRCGADCLRRSTHALPVPTCKIHHFKYKIPRFWTRDSSFCVHNSSFLMQNSSFSHFGVRKLATARLLRWMNPLHCKIHHFKHKIHHFEYNFLVFNTKFLRFWYTFPRFWHKTPRFQYNFIILYAYQALSCWRAWCSRPAQTAELLCRSARRRTRRIRLTTSKCCCLTCHAAGLRVVHLAKSIILNT